MESATCDHLSCEDVEPLLPLAADGAIDATSDPAVFVHLARCSDCQESLARHDLVTLGLECGRSQVCTIRSTGWHYRLPWPAAVAALVALAVLSGWLSQPSAPAAQDVVQVFRVPGSTPHSSYYKVVQGDRVSVIDPQGIDGALMRDAGDSHSVLRKVDNR
jgi:hypothetical protein